MFENLHAATSRYSTYRPELDVLRGFLLVWMTCTHLPTRLSHYSNQMIGYVSAAEGFIFLSAFLTGQVQRRTEIKYGRSIALRRLLRRALRIYGYHLALLAIAFTVAAAVAVYLDRTALKNLLGFYLANPTLAIAAAVPLVYKPPLFDILPMYVVFTLTTPVVLQAARKLGWPTVLAASLLVWLVAQFGFRTWLYGIGNRQGLAIPVQQAGAFDLFAWQLLWIVGVWVGTTSFTAALRPRKIPRALVIGSGVCAIVFLAGRYSNLDLPAAPGLIGMLLDKWKLGFLRLVDLAAVAMLVIRFGGPLAECKPARLFGRLGRASLQVFSAHVLLCLAVLGLTREENGGGAWWHDLLIVGISLSTLYWIADRAHPREIHRLSPSDQPATEIDGKRRAVPTLAGPGQPALILDHSPSRYNLP